METGIQIGKPY